jgi:hypothetical protein
MAEATTEPVADEAPEKGKTRRVLVSRELAAMADIEGILDDLDHDPEAVARVIMWVCNKYRVTYSRTTVAETGS